MAVDTINSSKLSQTVPATGSRTELVELALPKVVWVLQAYQKEGDAFVAEWPLKDISINTLHNLFQQPQDDPMYDSYPVSKQQLKALQSHTDHPIDLQKYDYFVECYAK